MPVFLPSFLMPLSPGHPSLLCCSPFLQPVVGFRVLPSKDYTWQIFLAKTASPPFLYQNMLDSKIEWVQSLDDLTLNHRTVRHVRVRRAGCYLWCGPCQVTAPSLQSEGKNPKAGSLLGPQEGR